MAPSGGKKVAKNLLAFVDIHTNAIFFDETRWTFAFITAISVSAFGWCYTWILFALINVLKNYLF